LSIDDHAPFNAKKIFWHRYCKKGLKENTAVYTIYEQFFEYIYKGG
jgi:hypothetical protein